MTIKFREDGKTDAYLTEGEMWESIEAAREERETKKQRCNCGTYPKEYCEAWPRCVHI